MDDAALVERASAGDRDAFGALYDRFATPLYDFLRRMLGNEHDAADALSETFLAAGARLHQLRDPTKVRAWLYAIARREAYRATRGRGRTRSEPLEDDDVTADEPQPVDAVVHGELATLVEKAADGLDDRDRAVLHLHFRHGLEGQELADALGVEGNHAHVLVHRLSDRLGRSLGALLVARNGDCAELASLLGGWDGTLTTSLRKRLARHVDRCPSCADTRDEHLQPAALLGALPLLAAPADARERILGSVELCSHTGVPWSAAPGGFPPSPARDRRRRPLVAAAVVVVALLLATGVASGLDPRGGDTPTGETVPPRQSIADDDPSTTDTTQVTSTASTATSTSTTTTEPAAPSSLDTAPSSTVDPSPSRRTTGTPGGTTITTADPPVSTTTTTSRPTTTSTTSRPTTTTTSQPTTTTTTETISTTTTTTTTQPRQTTTTTTAPLR